MKVAEIKEELMSRYGLQEDELVDENGKKLKKADLSELLESLHALEETGEIASEIEVPLQEEIKDDSDVPDITSADWTKYVLSHFEDDELDNGNPRVDGLRRVAELVLNDEIVQNEIDVEQVPSPQNQYRATVKVRIVFQSGRVFESAADVSPQNMKEPYSYHPVASAETRAEGRALRKALKLNKVVTAEEMNAPDAETRADMDSNDASPDMITGLRTMCKKDGLDLFKLAIGFRQDIESVDDLTRGEVIKITERINEYRQDPSKVPANVKAKQK